MTTLKEKSVRDDQEMDITVPARIANNSALFQKWFVNTYMSKFHQLPELLKPNERALIFDRNNNLEMYFEKVSKVVSFTMYGRDETPRLLEKTRLREVVMMRKVVCYIMSRKLGYSLTSVGKLLEKDHATVLYHSNCVENYIKFDKKFKSMFTEIQEGLLKLDVVW